MEKFSASAGRAAVTRGDDLGGLGKSLNKHFCRCNPAKIAKHVYVCIACYVYPEFGIIIKERTEGGLNKGAAFCAPLFSTLLVFPN